MMKYLYGASVKKIQSYIFESSKLQEIAGASELVEHICTDFFDDFIPEAQKTYVHKIIQAAGNIRVIIDDEETARYIMLFFLKAASEAAPGIQIVHAIVPLSGDVLASADSMQLEKELTKQLPDAGIYGDWSVTVKSRTTGKAVSNFSEMRDAGTEAKYNAVNKHWKNLRQLFNVSSFPSNVDDIAGTDNFVAVIHADGNSLGKTLMNLKDQPDYGECWMKFSQELDRATTEAARKSYEDICAAGKKFRPIILGGDDLTVICSADDAIPFTVKYLEYFKEEAAARSVLGNLTACAGIAFIKKNYPFFYGADLAEMLCSETKKRAKRCSEDPVPSSFMFAKELGGYVDQSFSAMEKRSLSADTEKGRISFAFGPWKTSCNEAGGSKLPCIEDLTEAAKVLKAYSPFHSGIRRYITELHVSFDGASFLADRIEEIAREKGASSQLEQLKQLLGKISGRKGNDPLRSILVSDNQSSPVLDLLTVSQFLCND